MRGQEDRRGQLTDSVNLRPFAVRVKRFTTQPGCGKVGGNVKGSLFQRTTRDLLSFVSASLYHVH